MRRTTPRSNRRLGKLLKCSILAVDVVAAWRRSDGSPAGERPRHRVADAVVATMGTSTGRCVEPAQAAFLAGVDL
jgi:hypothetical protein